MIKIALLAVILGVACAAPSGFYNGHGYDNVYGAASRVNDYNGLRQAQVNNIAEHVGAGIGTADYNGVPGTHVRKGAGYGVYGAAGYNAGYGTHGAASYNAGYSAHGVAGYNGAYGPHGAAGYNAAHGVHGAQGYGFHGANSQY